MALLYDETKAVTDFPNTIVIITHRARYSVC